MKRLVLGVIGHVDHGKTALVRALTGTDTDRLPEEKRRGISIALGFAHLDLPGVVVDLIDMPGHERFVRTMVAGATGIDSVLLVVAANEGVKPQTVEHVEIAALLGLRRAVVAVSKADLAASAAAATDAGALARRAGLEVLATVPVSALAGTGLDTLRDAIAALAMPPRAANGAPWLPIDRAFSVAGHGTVVTGTLHGGPLTAGGEATLLPADGPVRLRGLQVHGARVADALPGQRVAVSLRGVEAAAVGLGACLAAPGLLRPATWLTVMLRATATVATTARFRLLVGTQDVEARLRLLDRDALQPGDSSPAQLRCAEPVAVPVGQHLILRVASPPLTVAGGRILDTAALRLRRNDPAVLARLARRAAAAPEALVALEVELAGWEGTTLDLLAGSTGLAPPFVAAALQDGPALVLRRGAVVLRAALEAVMARIPRLLAEVAALPDAHLRAALPKVGEAVLDEALARLVSAGAVRREGGAVRLVRREQDARTARQALSLAERLAAALLAGGLTPPNPDALAMDVVSRQALTQLVRAGLAVRATDRVLKRDILFHRDAVALARRQLAPLLGEPGLKVTEAGAALGISRKFSVPLLEYLDSVQFTRRVGDRRTLGRNAAG